MSVTVELPEPVERLLAERAAGLGKTPAVYLAEVAERELSRPLTLAEIMAPVRDEFEASGMTEAELDALIDHARQEVWDERQRGAS